MTCADPSPLGAQMAHPAAAGEDADEGVKVGDKTLKEGQQLDSDQEGALPDISDKHHLKSLKCGLCQATVMEMAFGINRNENELGRKLKEVEVVEVLDKVCTQNMDKYGLMLDEKGQPTAQWSNSENSLRAKGGWVTRLALGTCADVYGEHEEYLVEMAPKSCSIDHSKKSKTCDTKPMVVEICAKHFKWCSVEQFNTPEQPAEPVDGEDAGGSTASGEEVNQMATDAKPDL
jgi:hypothetical protein